MLYDMTAAVVAPNGDLVVVRRESTSQLSSGVWTERDNPVELAGLRLVGQDVLALEQDGQGRGRAIYRWSNTGWARTLALREADGWLLWIEGPARAIVARETREFSSIHEVSRIDGRRRTRLRQATEGPLDLAWSDGNRIVLFGEQPDDGPAAFLYDGRAWTTRSLGFQNLGFTSSDTNDQPVFGREPTSLLHVGGYGALVVFDGTTSRPLGGEEFRAVDVGGTPDDLWVVSPTGTVYRRRSAAAR